MTEAPTFLDLLRFAPRLTVDDATEALGPIRRSALAYLPDSFRELATEIPVSVAFLPSADSACARENDTAFHIYISYGFLRTLLLYDTTLAAYMISQGKHVKLASLLVAIITYLSEWTFRELTESWYEQEALADAVAPDSREASLASTLARAQLEFVLSHEYMHALRHMANPNPSPTGPQGEPIGPDLRDALEEGSANFGAALAVGGADGDWEKGMARLGAVDCMLHFLHLCEVVARMPWFPSVVPMPMRSLPDLSRTLARRELFEKARNVVAQRARSKELLERSVAAGNAGGELCAALYETLTSLPTGQELWSRLLERDPDAKEKFEAWHRRTFGR